MSGTASSDFLTSLFGLSSKAAIVTGASRGIGAAIAEGLAQAGAYVVGVARSAKPDGGKDVGFTYHCCDILKDEEFAALCDRIGAEQGALDILVNAAGITSPAEENSQSAAVFEATIQTNLIAAYRCIRAASPYLRRPGGSIINITSIGSVIGFPGNPGYTAAKGGLRLMTRALAVDLGPEGIRVNNLAPGYIRTAMTQKSFDNARRRRQRARHTALGRWGEPDDLVGGAVFLASDASAYVTGQDLFVDGGWTAKGLVESDK